MKEGYIKGFEIVETEPQNDTPCLLADNVGRGPGKKLGYGGERRGID